jgi:predicted membrane chloride channel (bestrophin family)
MHETCSHETGFVLHLRSIIVLYLLCLPLYFLKVNGSWSGVPVTFIASYMLLGLEQLSREVGEMTAVK